jgi:hypothetical protein
MIQLPDTHGMLGGDFFRTNAALVSGHERREPP